MFLCVLDAVPADKSPIAPPAPHPYTPRAMTPSHSAPASAAANSARARLPRAPALAPGLSRAGWLDPEGALETLDHADALARARAATPIVCHVKATARRLGAEPFAAYDVLELYEIGRAHV